MTVPAQQPNILLVMVDQLAAPALAIHGHTVTRTPHIDAFARDAVIFDSAYCNFPICAPSRFSMLSGKLPHSISAWDNASEFPAATPTMAHYLRHAGYRTILCGKMHFIGPDQLHGYEERLTTDIYPADFAWTPDWRRGPGHRPTGVSMRPILEAGPCIRSLQVDYDDEVEYKAHQRLFDLARAPEQRPFFMTVSYTHPHPPFVSPQRHWDLYSDEEIDDPRVPEIPYEQLDPHSQWLYVAHAQDEYTVRAQDVRRARRAYYGMVSYVDEKVGSVLRVLEETGLADNTLVVLCGDHGEMLGERGMWFKQCFFEWSARVPLLIRWPGQLEARRVAAHVSLVDLLPTFLEAAVGPTATAAEAATADQASVPGEVAGRCVVPVDTLHGQSLLPLARGDASGEDRIVISEYSSEGVCAPSRMLREGPWKYIITNGLPPLLFNLASDPDELVNLADQPGHAELQARLHARLVADWDPPQVHARILESQKTRLFLAEVQGSSPRYSNWAYQPFVDESQRFIRGSGGAGPTAVKGRARYPFVAPVQPDKK
ncbi:MAG: choline-sulfatase [Betaproteobacteria bacterium]|nr:choline-sulfatase [Betaproteobacteria bacterium]NBS39729.1 choline-sulfatase [Betaproteobacteria bacterium]NBT06042.1 choline-sulfatase [Betaproteobacteria bacterium]NCV15294.1 choline-sulfatase [Betaproteobacteria bacterium]